MSVPPVLVRELAVAARRRGTWNLRVGFAAGLGVAFALGLSEPFFRGTQPGVSCLRAMALAAFLLCLGTGPFLTADSISSERRDGTLGLLFLTPLSGVQIILGKMLAHSLHVAGALLGTFPFLFLPVLQGGVVWGEVLRLILALLLTILGSLGVGMLASTLTEDSRSAALRTVAVLLALTALPSLGESLIPIRPSLDNLPGWIPLLSPLAVLNAAFESSYQPRIGPLPGVLAGPALFWAAAGFQLVLGVGAVALAGAFLPRLGREPRSSGRIRIQAPPSESVPDGTPRPRPPAAGEGTTPLTRSALRMLGEDRSLVVLRWGLASGCVLALVGAVSTSQWRELFLTAMGTAYVLHEVLRLQASWTAIRWLHEERRSGALELLLTTPVGDHDLVDAHHEALRRVLRRPLALLLGINALLQLALWGFAEHLHAGRSDQMVFSVLFLGGALATLSDFRALRWIGLQEALRRPTPARAAGMTFTRLIGVPWIILVVLLTGGVLHGNAATAAWSFAFWHASGLVWNHLNVVACRNWIRAGFRARLGLT